MHQQALKRYQTPTANFGRFQNYIILSNEVTNILSWYPVTLTTTQSKIKQHFYILTETKTKNIITLKES
jgi:hypothetical protein